jgi:hypothetical protein
VSHEASHCNGFVGLGAPEFLEAVDKLDPLEVVSNDNNAVGVLGEGNNFVIFQILGFHRVDKGVKVLVRQVILVYGTKVCKPAILEGHCAYLFSILFPLSMLLKGKSDFGIWGA